jgi:hypothetical protein
MMMLKHGIRSAVNGVGRPGRPAPRGLGSTQDGGELEAHEHADVVVGERHAGALQCMGVVDPVAGGSQHMAAGLERLYDARLEFGLIASIRETRRPSD